MNKEVHGFQHLKQPFLNMTDAKIWDIVGLQIILMLRDTKCERAKVT